MTIAVPKSLTLEEFLRLPYIDESPAWEYINGIAIQKTMGGGKHSILQKRLVALIDAAQGDYEAFPELRCTPNGQSVIPDVSVLARTTRLGWSIDPMARAIIVYQPGRLPSILCDEVLLPVMPGLSLELTPQQVFAWLKRR